MARAPAGYAAADGGDARHNRVLALWSAGGQSERLHPSLRHRLTRVRAAHHDVGGVDLVFDVIGGDIGKRSARLVRAGGTLVSIVGPSEARPADGLAVDFVVESDRCQLGGVVPRV